MKYFLFLLAVVLFTSGCSSRKIVLHQVTLDKYTQIPKDESPTYNLKNKTPITLALLEEYEKWKDTPFCYGGESREGVDCSAFVQSVFMDAFRVRVPRTTKEQAKSGYETSKDEIKAGDVVLFKTGWNSRHSGVYLERGNFMHTSKKHGVTISNLNNPYWKNNYWQTRRVLPQE